VDKNTKEPVMSTEQPYIPRHQRIAEASEAVYASGVPCTCPETGMGGCPAEIMIEEIVGGYTDEDYAWEAANMPARPQERVKERIPGPVRRAVYERDAYRCVVCGTWLDLTLDHIVPESKGGQATVDNLQTMCRTHNSQKGARL
jgi:hypothetical protein